MNPDYNTLYDHRNPVNTCRRPFEATAELRLTQTTWASFPEIAEDALWDTIDRLRSLTWLDVQNINVEAADDWDGEDDWKEACL